MVEIKTYVEVPKVPETVQALVIPDFRSNTELERPYKLKERGEVSW